jgi:HD-GYP domain-containing protein (c-di-GMP phosphodiesterase class II)
MEIALDVLSRTFSKAFDIIERERNGVSEHHSMRVAALCSVMGKRYGFDSDSLSAVAICALFHDNALTEYMLSEKEGTQRALNMRLHCEYGQRNVEWLPFKKNIDGFILYHHEHPGGAGPFGKKEGEYPLEAALIALADIVDVNHHLQRMTPAELPALRRWIQDFSVRDTRGISDVLIAALDEEMLESLRDEHICETLEKSLPPWTVSLENPSVICIAEFIARIIDYKSVFTRKHTIQIANRSWLMGGYYGYTKEQRAGLYLAAALHDIGKIATPAEILEKPGKLDKNEFEIIKQHVRFTHDWLYEVPGLEKICDWAADHHEKLSGDGYSFGKKAEELDFNSRLMACLDIYQAVSEERPYHPARGHENTIPILYGMAEKGFIDGKIVKDLDGVMIEYSMRDVPSPSVLSG